MRNLRQVQLWTLVLALAGPSSAWAAPTIVHQPPLEAKAGQAVTLNATVTDQVSPVQDVRLYFRASGTLGYQSQPLNGSGYLYSGLIPKEAVTGSGVDYYLEARNQAGETTTSPLMNPALAPHHLVVRAAAGAPVLRLLLPSDGTVLTPEEATVAVVGIESEPSRPDLSSLAVFFDEKNVTAQCTVSDTLITFALPAKLAEGLHGLRVRLRNQDGAEAESPTWSFTVRPAGAPVPAPTAVPGFRWSGGLNAESQYAAMTKDSQLVEFPAQPRGWLNRLNLNFNGQAGALGFLGSAYVTSEEEPGRQPVDRFRVEVFDPGFNLTLGDQYPIFSPYSLDNLFVRGGGLTLISGPRFDAHSLFQALGGLTRVAIGGRDYLVPGTYEQWLGAARWRYDLAADSGLGLNAVTVNDVRGSLTPEEASGTLPAANSVITGEASAKLAWSEQFHTLLFAEYGMSYYDEQMNAATVAWASALRGGMNFAWGGQSFVKLEYKDTGARYVSLASPWLIGDWRGLAGDAQVVLADDRLVFSASGNYWHDNLAGQKDPDPYGTSTAAGGTTTTLFLSGSVNYRIASWWPTLSLGYSLNRQQNDIEPAATLDNQTDVLNLGTGVQLALGSDQLLGNLSYSLTQFQDRVVPKYSPDVASSSFLLSGMYLLGQAWTFSAGFGLTGTETKTAGMAYGLLGGVTQRVNYTLANLRAAWKVVPGLFDAGAGWESLNGSDSLDLVENTLTTLSLDGTYHLPGAQSLTLTLSSIGYDDRIVAAQSYGQFVTNLRYALNF
jgi:hypothetical protein